jgi:hypothetical protein
MKFRFLIAGILLLNGTITARWASLFHKKVTPQEAMMAQRQHSYFFCQERIPLFTQLLFSWNAIRPTKGHFEFYVQARNAQTKQWGSWHRMMEWGKKLQSSNATISDGFTKYEHVRLETERQKFADAFRIKVVSTAGASLMGLKSLAVTTVNMRAFHAETVGAHVAQLPSVYIPLVPKISQAAINHKDNKRICSPVSCTMLTRYLTRMDIDPIKFADSSYDTGLNAYGSWPFNMAYAFELCKGKYWFFNTRLDSFVDLHKQLRSGIPLVVSLRGTLPGAAQSYPSGHLLVVVGWDSKNERVICHDPAMTNEYEIERRYRLKDFMKAWEQSRRLVYVASRVR